MTPPADGGASPDEAAVAYEVSVTVRADLVARFVAYMRETHIPDVLATGCFAGAALERAGDGRYRTRYVARNATALEQYRAMHAARLRADFGAHFPEGASATREEWTPVAAWGDTVPRPR